MKIVNLEEFRALPANTLFCLHKGLAHWANLRVKTEIFPDGSFAYIDFESPDVDDTEARLLFEGRAVEDKSSFPLDLKTVSVWHAHEQDHGDHFVIYEPNDIEGILKALTACLGAALVPILDAIIADAEKRQGWSPKVTLSPIK